MPEIEQHDVRLEGLRQRQRLDAIVGGADLVARELELQRQRLCRVVVVVGDENPLRIDRGNRARLPLLTREARQLRSP